MRGGHESASYPLPYGSPSDCGDTKVARPQCGQLWAVGHSVALGAVV